MGTEGSREQCSQLSCQLLRPVKNPPHPHRQSPLSSSIPCILICNRPGRVGCLGIAFPGRGGWGLAGSRASLRARVTEPSHDYSLSDPSDQQVSLCLPPSNFFSSATREIVVEHRGFGQRTRTGIHLTPPPAS